VSMAFGQKADANNNPWGDTPGYDEYGLRPLRPLNTYQARRGLEDAFPHSNHSTCFTCGTGPQGSKKSGQSPRLQLTSARGMRREIRKCPHRRFMKVAEMAEFSRFSRF